VTVTGGVTGGSANAESADEKPLGISNSEDADLSFREAAGFPFRFLRCLGPLALEVLQHRCLVRANLARAVDAPFDIESGS
jgi:hypothetical protein